MPLLLFYANPDGTPGAHAANRRNNPFATGRMVRPECFPSMWRLLKKKKSSGVAVRVQRLSRIVMELIRSFVFEFNADLRRLHAAPTFLNNIERLLAEVGAALASSKIIKGKLRAD